MNPVNYPPELRQTRKAIAFHEAGHALSALVHGLPFSRVWILAVKESSNFPDGTNVGEVTRNLDRPSFFGRLDDAKVEVVQAMAGPLAECLPFPGMQPDWRVNANDMNDATAILKFALLPHTVGEDGRAEFDEEQFKAVAPQIQQFLQECYGLTVAFIQAHIPAIVRIAEALMTRLELTPEEVRQLALPSKAAKEEKQP